MRFLVYQHTLTEGLGAFEPVLKKNEVEAVTARLWELSRAPDSQGFDALIILGSHDSVYDRSPMTVSELACIGDAISEDLPILGICFGSQLLAEAIGGKVEKHAVKEIGLGEVRLTDHGKRDPLFLGFTPTFDVMQWHGDAFSLPESALLLATNAHCRNQAFRFEERQYGVLFHLEWPPAVYSSLTEEDKAWVQAGDRPVVSGGNIIMPPQVLQAKDLAVSSEKVAGINALGVKLMENFIALVEE